MRNHSSPAARGASLPECLAAAAVCSLLAAVAVTGAGRRGPAAEAAARRLAYLFEDALLVSAARDVDVTFRTDGGRREGRAAGGAAMVERTTPGGRSVRYRFPGVTISSTGDGSVVFRASGSVSPASVVIERPGGAARCVIKVGLRGRVTRACSDP